MAPLTDVVPLAASSLRASVIAAGPAGGLPDVQLVTYATVLVFLAGLASMTDAARIARLNDCGRLTSSGGNSVRAPMLMAALGEAERATRLIGPALVSPAQPSRPDAPELSGGAS